MKINQALQMSILQSLTLLTPMHLQTSRKKMSILSKDCVVQDSLEISLHQKLRYREEPGAEIQSEVLEYCFAFFIWWFLIGARLRSDT